MAHLWWRCQIVLLSPFTLQNLYTGAGTTNVHLLPWLDARKMYKTRAVLTWWWSIVRQQQKFSVYFNKPFCGAYTDEWCFPDVFPLVRFICLMLASSLWNLAGHSSLPPSILFWGGYMFTITLRNVNRARQECQMCCFFFKLFLFLKGKIPILIWSVPTY